MSNPCSVKRKPVGLFRLATSTSIRTHHAKDGSRKVSRTRPSPNSSGPRPSVIRPSMTKRMRTRVPQSHGTRRPHRRAKVAPLRLPATFSHVTEFGVSGLGVDLTLDLSGSECRGCSPFGYTILCRRSGAANRHKPCTSSRQLLEANRPVRFSASTPREFGFHIPDIFDPVESEAYDRVPGKRALTAAEVASSLSSNSWHMLTPRAGSDSTVSSRGPRSTSSRTTK